VDLAFDGVQGGSAVENGDLPEGGDSELEIGDESA
ncbi:MAG: hypothetical protein RIS00_1889, partial [Pseudomonadota bacterium]